MAGAFRWGLVIQITTQAVTVAHRTRASRLNRSHFVDWWVSKTKVAPAATPFLHRDFGTMFRKDHSFVMAIDD